MKKRTQMSKAANKKVEHLELVVNTIDEVRLFWSIRRAHCMCLCLFVEPPVGWMKLVQFLFFSVVGKRKSSREFTSAARRAL